MLDLVLRVRNAVVKTRNKDGCPKGQPNTQELFEVYKIKEEK